MELWKEAYRTQFGTDADDDMPANGAEVEAWRASWEGGYSAGEAWALALVGGSGEDQSDPDGEGEDE